MSESGGVGYCCGKFILTLGLTALFVWLTLRAYKPACSINQFYLPALNHSSGNATASNTTIFMLVRLSNGNKEKGIHYDPVNVTVYFFGDPNRTRWHQTIPGFYQGFQKKANKNASFQTFGINWTDVTAARNGPLVFRVDLATAIRFKIMFWKTKRHKLLVGANVTVDNGVKNTQKGIKMKSGASRGSGSFCFWRMGFSLGAMILAMLY